MLMRFMRKSGSLCLQLVSALRKNLARASYECGIIQDDKWEITTHTKYTKKKRGTTHLPSAFFAQKTMCTTFFFGVSGGAGKGRCTASSRKQTCNSSVQIEQSDIS